MNQYKSISELKFISRMQMNGKLGILVAAMFIELVLSTLAMNLVDIIIPATSAISSILNYIVSFIVQLLTYVLQVGVCLFHLHVACEMPCQISDLFYGFKNNPDKAIKIGLILAIINTICAIPCYFIQPDMRPLLTYIQSANPASITFGELQSFYAVYTSFILVSLVCSVVYFIVTLSFFPALYMILDFPHDTVGTILKRCFEVMRGNRIRYILLDLSFIPMIILSVFTCGIALLWVIPHMQVTFANFYLDLITNRPSQNVVE